jgi:hypothetical protein
MSVAVGRSNTIQQKVWRAVEAKRKEAVTSAADSSARVEKRSAKERRQEDSADKESKNQLDGVREKISEALKRFK